MIVWFTRTENGFGFDLPMGAGAIAMSLSTIIVAANAQLLRRLKLQQAPL